MRFRSIFAFVALLGLLVAPRVEAQTDVTPDLGTTVPGSWQTDRYTPPVFQLTNGFQGRNDVLQIGTNSTADAANRPAGQQSTFYNTQGMKTNVNTLGSWSYALDLFVPIVWQDVNNGVIRTDIWATATSDPGLTNPAAYPIVGFTNYGGTGLFRGYDVNTGLWINSGATVNYDQWNTLGMSFDALTNTFTYWVNNNSFAQLLSPAPTGVRDVMVQAYNFNDPALGIQGNPAFNAHWSNVPAVTGVVPEPASMALMATGLLGLGGAGFRRRKKPTSQS